MHVLEVEKMSVAAESVCTASQSDALSLVSELSHAKVIFGCGHRTCGVGRKHEFAGSDALARRKSGYEASAFDKDLEVQGRLSYNL